MDSGFLKAIRCLNSNAPESTEIIRGLLEEALKSKYGPGRELKLDPEDYATPPASTSDSTKAKDDITSSSSDNDLELDLLKDDLMCIICKGMTISVRNKLVECKDCHNLYHQECHDPTISEEDSESDSIWTCATCDVPGVKSPKRQCLSSSASASGSKTSSNNSLSSSKSYDKDLSDSSGSSKSSTKSTSRHSTPSRLLPNINLVSADKRLQIMKKKAAKMQEKKKLSR